MNTYEFYVKVPVYVPIRCEAPDIGTAELFEKGYRKMWPDLLKRMCPAEVPSLKKVKRNEKKQYVVSLAALNQVEYDWLAVAEALSVIRDPGEDLQYRD